MSKVGKKATRLSELIFGQFSRTTQISWLFPDSRFLMESDNAASCHGHYKNTMRFIWWMQTQHQAPSPQTTRKSQSTCDVNLPVVCYNPHPLLPFIVISMSLSINRASMRAYLTDWLPSPSVGLSVCWLICLSLRKVYCGKMADWIQVLLGVVSGVGRGIGVLDRAGDHQRGRGSFGGEFGASSCNQIVMLFPNYFGEDLLLNAKYSFHQSRSRSMHWSNVWHSAASIKAV